MRTQWEAPGPFRQLTRRPPRFLTAAAIAATCPSLHHLSESYPSLQIAAIAATSCSCRPTPLNTGSPTSPSAPTAITASSRSSRPPPPRSSHVPARHAATAGLASTRSAPPTSPRPRRGAEGAGELRGGGGKKQ